jgi:hypothetical protein
MKKELPCTAALNGQYFTVRYFKDLIHIKIFKNNVVRTSFSSSFFSFNMLVQNDKNCGTEEQGFSRFL